MSPLSAIYGGVARLRRSWYDASPSRRRHLSRPVISVGNLVVGGAGKTPVVMALARTLLQDGQRPAILSRGYARRRSVEGVLVVADGERLLADVDESGDEPQMLARALPGVPVLVAHDRYLAGRLAESQFDATVLLLDDGFQHVQLARSLDLLVMAAGDLQADVLPSGPLREPLAAARAAHAVLVYGSEDDAHRIAEAVGVHAAFSVVPRYRSLQVLGAAGSTVEPERRRVVGLAGIARPYRFFDALRANGFEVVREMAFRDHHWFTVADLERIAAESQSAGVTAVVTTAKDAVRLDRLPRDTRLHWLVLPMDVAIEPAARFTAWLGQHL